VLVEKPRRLIGLDPTTCSKTKIEADLFLHTAAIFFTFDYLKIFNMGTLEKKIIHLKSSLGSK
jgi:hypothetical protein